MGNTKVDLKQLEEFVCAALQYLHGGEYGDKQF